MEERPMLSIGKDLLSLAAVSGFVFSLGVLVHAI